MSDSTHNTNVEPNEHALLEELVAIRDGDISAVAAHVDECVFCQARLEEVHCTARSLQEALLFEAELPVPSAVWTKLETQLENQSSVEFGHVNTEAYVPRDKTFFGPQSHGDQLSGHLALKPSFWTSINSAIYSLAAAVMFTGAVSLYTFHGQQGSRVETQALQASIQSLMDNSRGLESVLQQVAARNSVLTLSDQSTVERLQWRLMLVDEKIHESESTDDISYEQIKALWAARIDALTELNQLYYTNQVASSSGEF